MYRYQFNAYDKGVGSAYTAYRRRLHRMHFRLMRNENPTQIIVANIRGGEKRRFSVNSDSSGRVGSAHYGRGGFVRYSNYLKKFPLSSWYDEAEGADRIQFMEKEPGNENQP